MKILISASSKVYDLWSLLSTYWMPRTLGLRGTKDPVILEIAAQQGRIVISHDRKTMTRYFWERLAAGKSNPGLFIVPQRSAIGDVVESLLLVWAASQAAEWHGAIVYLPFR
jgi:hypothetical protein